MKKMLTIIKNLLTLKDKDKGAVSVYMAITIIIIMTASAVALSGIIVRQFRLSTDVEHTARAFYAASTGMENALRQALVIQRRVGDSFGLNGVIQYDEGGSSNYIADVVYLEVDGSDRQLICVDSTGSYRTLIRRMALEESDDC